MALTDEWTNFEYVNATNFYQTMSYANDVTDGLFTTGVLGAVFFILYAAFSRYGSDRAFAASSFICTVLATMLRGIGAVSDGAMVVFIMMTAVGILMLGRRN